MTKTNLTHVRRRKYDDEARFICRNKRRYSTKKKAWQKAALYYHKYGDLNCPYSCTAGRTLKHYHLTTKTSIGNMGHIPQEYRHIFTHHHESFVQKIKKFIKRFFA
jgi:hypothetical protein